MNNTSVRGIGYMPSPKILSAPDLAHTPYLLVVTHSAHCACVNGSREDPNIVPMDMHQPGLSTGGYHLILAHDLVPILFPVSSVAVLSSNTGTTLVDSSSERGRELGPFEGLCSPQQCFERASSSIWASITPTTTSAHTTTTTTLTSTVVTCTAVGGPAYVPYVSGLSQGD